MNKRSIASKKLFPCGKATPTRFARKKRKVKKCKEQEGKGFDVSVYPNGLSSPGRNTDNSKPKAVALEVGRVPMAVSRATISRSVEPGAASQKPSSILIRC